MLSVEPVITTSYTDRGNKYKKSNAGKYGAAATVGAGATIVTMKGIKDIPFNKVKDIKFDKLKHIELPKIKNVKIKTPNAKNLLQKMFAGIEQFAIKAQIKLAKPAKKAAEKVAEKAAKSNAFSKAWQGIKNFTKNTGRKTVDKVLNLANQHTTKMKYAGFVLGAVAAGLAIDYLFNKISAHRADKKA
jgi:hypothetical protein